MVYMLLVYLWFRGVFSVVVFGFWLARLVLRWFCLSDCLSVGNWLLVGNCGCLRCWVGACECLVVFNLGLLILVVAGYWYLGFVILVCLILLGFIVLLFVYVVGGRFCVCD